MVLNFQYFSIIILLIALHNRVSAALYEKFPFSDIRVDISETFELPLNEIFSGPDMNFAVTGLFNTTNTGQAPYIQQRSESISVTSKSSGQFNAHFGRPYWIDSTTFWAVDGSNYVLWNCTDLQNPSILSTVSLLTYQGLSLFPQQTQDETYLATVTAGSFLVIHQLNVTDPDNPTSIQQRNVDFSTLNEVKWQDLPYMNATWAAISYYTEGITAVYSVPYDTTQPIARLLLFDNTFLNTTDSLTFTGAALFEQNLFVCVQDRGIYKVDVVTNSTSFLSFPLDQNDGLIYCTVDDGNLLVTTYQATFVFQPRTMQVTHSFYRNYPHTSYPIRSFANQMTQQGTFITYQSQESSSGYTTSYFEIWDFDQEPNSALIASIPISSLFSIDDYPTYPSFSFVPNLPQYVVFCGRFNIYVIELIKNPTMVIDAGLNESYEFDGEFQVTSEGDQITTNFKINAISLNNTDIYNWRGNLKDRGYSQPTNIRSYLQNAFNETNLWIPLQNYLVGQNITYRAYGNDTLFDISIPSKYSIERQIPIQPDTYNHPNLDVKTSETSLNSTDYLAFIDGTNVYVYVYDIKAQTYQTYQTECMDGNQTPNLVAFLNTNSTQETQIRLALECFATNTQGGFDVTVQVYYLANQLLNLVQKVSTNQVMYSTKMIFEQNNIFCLRGRQIDTYLYNSTNETVQIGIPISAGTTTLQYDLNPIDFVVTPDGQLLFLYDFNQGIIGIVLHDLFSNTFYYAYNLGQVQGFRNKDVKLYLGYGLLTMINPYSSGNDSIVSLSYTYNLERFENITVSVMHTVPQIRDCKPQGMAIGTNFLAINCKQFGNNQLFVIDANSPIFYGIYSIIPIERFGFMGISKTTYIPNLYYIQDGQLSVYKIGQTFSNGQTPPTSSPFILSTENEATTWAAVQITQGNSNRDYYEQIIIQGQVGNNVQNVTITLDIQNQGQTPAISDNFDPQANSLTNGAELKVKKQDLTYTIPYDIATGQAVNYEFVNDQTKQRFRAQQQCSQSQGPFCTESKSFLFTNLSQADAIDYSNGSIFISANSTVTEYNQISQSNSEIGLRFDLTVFGEGTQCLNIRSISNSYRFIASCSQTVQQQTTYFTAYFDLWNPNRTAVLQNEFQVQILDVYENIDSITQNATVYVCAKDYLQGQIYQITYDSEGNPNIEWTFYIDAYGLDTVELNIIGMYHLNYIYVIVIGSDGQHFLFMYQQDELVVVKEYQLDAEFYTGTELIVAATAISSARNFIYNILQSGDVYQVQIILNSSLTVFLETNHIPAFNENTSVNYNIASLYNDNYLVFPLTEVLQDQVSVIVRQIDLTQSTYSAIYDDTVIDSTNVPTLINALQARVIFFQQAKQNFVITNLGFNGANASVFQYRYSLTAYLYKPVKNLLYSTEKYTVYLAACNADSCTQLGSAFNVEFEDDSSSSDDEVYDDWWFWFIIVLIALAVIASVIVIVVYMQKRKRQENLNNKHSLGDQEIGNPIL